MISDRQHFRVRKQLDVDWSVPDQKIGGEGRISNISLSGMMFVTDKLFEPGDGLKMGFVVTQISCFPSHGNLVWFRKVGPGGAQYQCGIKFSKEFICSHAWIKWMEENVSTLADASGGSILGHYLNEGQE